MYQHSASICRAKSRRQEHLKLRLWKLWISQNTAGSSCQTSLGLIFSRNPEAATLKVLSISTFLDEQLQHIEYSPWKGRDLEILFSQYHIYYFINITLSTSSACFILFIRVQIRVHVFHSNTSQLLQLRIILDNIKSVLHTWLKKELEYFYKETNAWGSVDNTK